MLYLHTKRLFLVIIQLKTMNNIHYNRIKAVLAEKDKTGTWLSEKMDRNIGTVFQMNVCGLALLDCPLLRRGCEGIFCCRNEYEP